MTQDEACDLILWGLFDKEMAGMRTATSGLNGFIEEKGGDSQLVGRAGNYLNDLGLLAHFHGVTGFFYNARISPKAVRLMETLSRGDSVMAALHAPHQEPRRGDTYYGTVIQGGVYESNVAIESPDARQSIANSSDTQRLVEALIAALKSDTTLRDDRRAEALENAGSLKDELEKVRPDSRVVMRLLGWLSGLALASEYITKIKEALGR